MARKVRDNNIPPVRIAAQLRRELESAAEEEGRSLSGLVRKLLIDFAERRFTQREAA